MEARRRNYAGLSLIFICLIIVLIYGNPAIKTLGTEVNGLNLMLEVFNKSGTKFEKYTITGWVKLNDNWVDMVALRTFAQKAANKMQKDAKMQADAKMQTDTAVQTASKMQTGTNLQKETDAIDWVETTRVDDGIRVLTLTGKQDSGTAVEIIIQSIQHQNADPATQAETYALITLHSNIKLEDLVNHKNQVYTALKLPGNPQEDEKIHISSIIQGSSPGKLSRPVREKLITKLFSQLKASKVEGIDTENIISWSGYSPLLPDELEVGNKTININIASRYSTTTQKTLLLMATPIISIEY